jgi:hypothetical protein
MMMLNREGLSGTDTPAVLGDGPVQSQCLAADAQFLLVLSCRLVFAPAA